MCKHLRHKRDNSRPVLHNNHTTFHISYKEQSLHKIKKYFQMLLQSWYLTLANEIKRDYGCFDYSVQNGLQVEGCHQMGGNQKWSYREVCDTEITHV